VISEAKPFSRKSSQENKNEKRNRGRRASSRRPFSVLFRRCQEGQNWAMSLVIDKLECGTMICHWHCHKGLSAEVEGGQQCENTFVHRGLDSRRLFDAIRQL
jgi:hypothetical protein